MKLLQTLTITDPVGPGPVTTHTLVSLPGYGIVPDATVADYTALDAFVGTGWVEVTTGEAMSPEIFYVDTNVVVAGPFGSWIKNARYTLGDNNEDILIVDVDYSVIQNSSPVNSISSKVVLPAETDMYSQSEAWQYIRFASCVPIFTAPATYAADYEPKIINAIASDTAPVLVLGIQGQGTVQNGFSIGSTANPPFNDLNGLLILGRGRSGHFRQYGLELYADQTRYEGFAGLPAIFSTTVGRSRKFLTISLNTTKGYAEWDYASVVGTTTSLTYVPNGTTQIDLRKYAPQNRSFVSNVNTGGTTWEFILDNFDGPDQAFRLVLTNGGSQVQTWPVNVVWDSGAAPTLSTGTDVLLFVANPVASGWFGFHCGTDMS